MYYELTSNSLLCTPGHRDNLITINYIWFKTSKDYCFGFCKGQLSYYQHLFLVRPIMRSDHLLLAMFLTPLLQSPSSSSSSCLPWWLLCWWSAPSLLPPDTVLSSLSPVAPLSLAESHVLLQKNSAI